MTTSTAVFTGSPEVDVERRRALRALLRNPLLPSAGDTADEYNLVRRHSEWLKHWLAKFPSWSLYIDRDVVRLRKVPPDLLDETRPAIDRTSGTSFSRRRYALFCLALAALEQSDRQTTLARIAHTIFELASSDRELQTAGIIFDIGNYDQRRDLVHAVRLMVDIGVLRRLDGDERQFLNRNTSADVLYDINRTLLSSVLNVSCSVSAAERLPTNSPVRERAARLIDPPLSANEDAHSQRIRARLVRALLDDPILYFHDLDDEELVYFERHRGYLLRQVYEATGLIAEVRREGVAMVDDAGDLTDLQLPEEGTDGHLTLLLVQWLAECCRNRPGTPIPVSDIEEHVRGLIQIHGSRWRKEVREAGAESRLAEEALFRLRGLRLIQWTDGGVIPLAASGRYALGDSVNAPDDEE